MRANAAVERCTQMAETEYGVACGQLSETVVTRSYQELNECVNLS